MKRSSANSGNDIEILKTRIRELLTTQDIQQLQFKHGSLKKTAIELFNEAIDKATDSSKFYNNVEVLIRYLQGNYENSQQIVERLSSILKDFKKHLSPNSAKKLIINFNGTGCPVFVGDSIHERYLLEQLLDPNVLILNLPGVGITDDGNCDMTDMRYAYSTVIRLNLAKEFIKDNANRETEIITTGHSRGAVSAIILGKILSQHYPNTTVISHDPVPGRSSVSDYFNEQISVEVLSPNSSARKRSLLSLLNDETLKPKHLHVIYRTDDVRKNLFTLLDIDGAYTAHNATFTAAPGYHNCGLYGVDANYDIEVIWKSPVIGLKLKSDSTSTNQHTGPRLDSNRNAMKTVLQKSYKDLFYSYLAQREVNDFAAHFLETKRRINASLHNQLLYRCMANRNPAYHVGRTEYARIVPIKLMETMAIEEGDTNLPDLLDEDFLHAWLKKHTASELGVARPQLEQMIFSILHGAVFNIRNRNDTPQKAIDIEILHYFLSATYSAFSDVFTELKTLYPKIDFCSLLRTTEKREEFGLVDIQFNSTTWKTRFIGFSIEDCLTRNSQINTLKEIACYYEEEANLTTMYNNLIHFYRNQFTTAERVHFTDTVVRAWLGGKPWGLTNTKKILGELSEEIFNHTDLTPQNKINLLKAIEKTNILQLSVFQLVPSRDHIPLSQKIEILRSQADQTQRRSISLA